MTKRLLITAIVIAAVFIAAIGLFNPSFGQIGEVREKEEGLQADVLMDAFF